MTGSTLAVFVKTEPQKGSDESCGGNRGKLRHTPVSGVMVEFLSQRAFQSIQSRCPAE